MVKLTGPEKFLTQEEYDIIDAIESCFKTQHPKFGLKNNKTCLGVAIAITSTIKSCDLVASLYRKSGWSDVIHELSEDRGERKGCIYFTFFV